jgi:RNA polymerase sigma-70 factor (ECF subfamily)
MRATSECARGASLTPTTLPRPNTPAIRLRRLDPESRRWLERLAPGSPDRDEAIEALHALLLGAARFEISRRRAMLPHLRGGDHDDLAQQSADDALVAVLAKLDNFRGDSRFTTWVYKFALLEAAVKVRRRAWQGREIPLAPERWDVLGSSGSSPQQGAEAAELVAAIRRAIAEDLTAHQRTVLVAVVLDGVPIDVLADRLGTTRGALYKTVHDARRRLRVALAADGHGIDGEEVGR